MGDQLEVAIAGPVVGITSTDIAARTVQPPKKPTVSAAKLKSMKRNMLHLLPQGPRHPDSGGGRETRSSPGNTQAKNLGDQPHILPTAHHFLTGAFGNAHQALSLLFLARGVHHARNPRAIVIDLELGPRCSHLAARAQRRWWSSGRRVPAFQSLAVSLVTDRGVLVATTALTICTGRRAQPFPPSPFAI
jgi:hypothetical protein